MGRVKYFWSEEFTGKRIGPDIPEEGDRTKPFSDKYWSEIEVLPHQRIKEIQWKRFEVLLKFVYENSPFYRRKWDEAKVKPSDIKSLEDIVKLPIITKQDCAKDREEHPPYGTIATSPPHTHQKCFQTSGTTGRPQFWTYTLEDIENNMVVSLRGLYDYGVRRGWRAFFGFGFVPFVGFWGMWGGLELYGCQCIPKGAIPTAAWLNIMKSLAGTSPHSLMCSTPTYAVRQLEAAKEMGINPHDLKIDLVAVSGEPGYGIPATHKLIKEGWNAGLMDFPGTTEAGGPIMNSCKYLADQGIFSEHLAEDYYIVETLDPETLEPVMADENGRRSGVSCITNVSKFGMPAIRLLINDHLTIIEGKKCGCGRTLAIVEGGIQARADDMLKVSGVKLYPALIEDAIRSIPELSPEYRIQRKEMELKVLVEPQPGIPKEDYEKLAVLLQAKIKEKALVTLGVEVLQPRSLPREEAKTKRIIS